MDRLAPPRQFAVEIPCQVLDPHARAGRIGIGADNPPQPHPERRGVAHADMGGESLSGPVREAVEIAGDRKFFARHYGPRAR